MTERVLFFGSRSWEDEEPIRREIDALPEGAVVIHGAAHGADLIAGRLAEDRGLTVLPYPAEWFIHAHCHCKDKSARICRAAGVMRNIRMLRFGMPERAVGFRKAGYSPGTDDMERRARRAGLPVKIVRQA